MPPRRWPWVAALAAAASSGPLLYPAYLTVAGWRRQDGRPDTDGRSGADPCERRGWPDVTVVVPAYREAGVIAAKVADVMGNGYPGALHVLVVADGDPDTAAAARAAGAAVIEPPRRLGKSQALNAGFAAATTPVVVVSDANNRIAPGSITALVAHLDDPSVGAVTGEKTEDDKGGEGLYWRFESWLKQREWRLGTTIGFVGELSAVRREAWRPIPSDVSSDDLWTAMDLSERGYRIAYEPRAMAIDPPVPSIRDQWERRTRMVCGALQVFARRPRQLGPAGGNVAVQVWGHRLARYTVSPLAHAALVCIAVERSRSSRLARGFLALHLVGLGSLLRRAADPSARTGTVPTALGQFVFLQGVALGGMWRYLRGDRIVQWIRLERPGPAG